MSTELNPYLAFRDDARQAMEFYRSVFGGELTLSTFAEFGATQDPAEADKVMHAHLRTDAGLVLMASDTPASMPFDTGSRISISLSGDDATALRGYWDALSAGGQVVMPLEPAPWGDTFGMCVDRFGISWMVDISGAAAGQSTAGQATAGQA